MTKKFTVKDTNGRVLFKSEAAETDISAKKLNIQSKASFKYYMKICYR